MPNLPHEKKSARARRAKQMESSPERRELEQLRRAEEELGAIFVAMEPLWKALPRVRQHYEWLWWLNREVAQLQAETPRPAETPSDAEEYCIPELVIRDGLRRPEIMLGAINPEQPPNPDRLYKEIEAFYSAFNSLFGAALAVGLPPTVNLPVVEDEYYLETEHVPVEVMARRALERVLDRNSLRKRYQVVASLLRAVIERRRLLERWHTPEGRREQLRVYCERHQLTIDRFAELVGCDRSSIYNWLNCKGLGTGWCAKLIEQVLRQNIPPDGIAALKAKLKPESL